MQPPIQKKTVTRVGSILAALFASGHLTGCYERVVRASGPTAHTVEVHEPNMKSDRIPIVDDVEDAIFGEKYPEKSNIPENRRISTSK